MRTKETTVYTFDELSDTAKDCARYWYRNGALDYDWWEGVYDDAAAIADLLGIDLRTKRTKLMNGTTRMDPSIYFSGFSSQGDGACFEGTYEYRKDALKAVKAYASKDEELHRIARALTAAQRPYFYRLGASVTTQGRYSHSGTMNIEVYDTEDSRRDVNPEPIRRALRDFADWIYRALAREYDWLNSDEQVDETIRTNEYEFDEDGRPT